MVSEDFKFEPLDLSHFSVRKLPELSCFPFDEPFPEIQFSDEWVFESDSFYMPPIPIGEIPVPDFSDIKTFDFAACDERLIEQGESMEEEALQNKPITIQDPIISEIKREAPPLVDGGSLIEKEMEKISLVGASESSTNDGVASIASKTSGCLVQVKTEGSDVSMVVDYVSDVRVEEENGNGVDEVPVVGESKMPLAMDQADDVTLGSKPPVVKIGSDKEDSDSGDSESGSDSEMESDGSSSSSSSSSSEEEKEVEEGKEGNISEIEEGEIRDVDEGILGGSDEEDEDIVKGPIKSKNEIEILPPVPPVNVTLEPHHQTSHVGEILSIMEKQVVVEGIEKHNPLSEGSILWLTETRSPLGQVDEIFGPVKNPYYIVRYNTEEEMPAGVNVGAPVSFVAQFTDFVLNDSNLYKKGYDASGENDEELSDELEFCDDEEEAEYRRAQRARNGANDKKRGNQDSGNRKKFQQKGTIGKNSQPPQPFVAPMGQSSHDPNMGHPSIHPNICQSSNNTNMGHPSNNPCQFHMPPGPAGFGANSFGGAFGSGPDSVNGPVSVPPASHVVQNNSFTPSVPQNVGVWMNGAAFPLQQPMFFPNGFQMNGMLPRLLNPHQHQSQMFTGFPAGMQIQQQFNPSQMMPPNMGLPYRQANVTPGQSTSWLGLPGQAAFNQAQFGMGFQGQPTTLNAGGPGAFPNGSFSQQNNAMPPSTNLQGNFPAPARFSQGINSTCGRPNQCRGGNFSGRRGRQ